MVLTSALASSVRFLASSSSRKPGLSAPGFTTMLSSTPATARQREVRACCLKVWLSVCVCQCVSYRRPLPWLQVWEQTAALMGSSPPPATPTSLWSERSAWRSVRETTTVTHLARSRLSFHLRLIKALAPCQGWSGWVPGRRRRNTSSHCKESSWSVETQRLKERKRSEKCLPMSGFHIL